MGKVNGRPSGTPIVRPPCETDPAIICPHIEREPGSSKRKNKPGYEENVLRRKRQSYGNR